MHVINSSLHPQNQGWSVFRLILEPCCMHARVDTTSICQRLDSQQATMHLQKHVYHLMRDYPTNIFLIVLKEYTHPHLNLHLHHEQHHATREVPSIGCVICERYHLALDCPTGSWMDESEEWSDIPRPPPGRDNFGNGISNRTAVDVWRIDPPSEYVMAAADVFEALSTDLVTRNKPIRVYAAQTRYIEFWILTCLQAIKLPLHSLNINGMDFRVSRETFTCIICADYSHRAADCQKARFVQRKQQSGLRIKGMGGADKVNDHNPPAFDRDFQPPIAPKSMRVEHVPEETNGSSISGRDMPRKDSVPKTPDRSTTSEEQHVSRDPAQVISICSSPQSTKELSPPRTTVDQKTVEEEISVSWTPSCKDDVKAVLDDDVTAVLDDDVQDASSNATYSPIAIEDGGIPDIVAANTITTDTAVSDKDDQLINIVKDVDSVARHTQAMTHLTTRQDEHESYISTFQQNLLVLGENVTSISSNLEKTSSLFKFQVESDKSIADSVQQQNDHYSRRLDEQAEGMRRMAESISAQTEHMRALAESQQSLTQAITTATTEQARLSSQIADKYSALVDIGTTMSQKHEQLVQFLAQQSTQHMSDTKQLQEQTLAMLTTLHSAISAIDDVSQSRTTFAADVVGTAPMEMRDDHIENLKYEAIVNDMSEHIPAPSHLTGMDSGHLADPRLAMIDKSVLQDGIADNLESMEDIIDELHAALGRIKEETIAANNSARENERKAASNARKQVRKKDGFRQLSSADQEIEFALALQRQQAIRIITGADLNTELATVYEGEYKMMKEIKTQFAKTIMRKCQAKSMYGVSTDPEAAKTFTQLHIQAIREIFRDIITSAKMAEQHIMAHCRTKATIRDGFSEMSKADQEGYVQDAIDVLKRKRRDLGIDAAQLQASLYQERNSLIDAVQRNLQTTIGRHSSGDDSEEVTIIESMSRIPSRQASSVGSGSRLGKRTSSVQDSQQRPATKRQKSNLS